MKNQNIPRHYLFGIYGWLPLRSAFLLLSTCAALLGASLTTQGAPVTFVVTGSLATARAGQPSGHTATLLPNGKVLVAGGGDTASINPTAENYDPTSGTCTARLIHATPRRGHTPTQIAHSTVLVPRASR